MLDITGSKNKGHLEVLIYAYMQVKNRSDMISIGKIKQEIVKPLFRAIKSQFYHWSLPENDILMPFGNEAKRKDVTLK